MKKGTGELLECLRKAPDLSVYIKEASDDMIESVPLSDYLKQMLLKFLFKEKEVHHETNYNGTCRADTRRNS